MLNRSTSKFQAQSQVTIFGAHRTAGFPLFVRAVTLKQGPHRCPGGGDIQKSALSDSGLSLKNVFRAFWTKSPTPGGNRFFVDVCTPFPRQGGPPKKTVCHMEPGSNQRDRATAGLGRGRSHGKPGKTIYWRGFLWGIRFLGTPTGHFLGGSWKKSRRSSQQKGVSALPICLDHTQIAPSAPLDP